MFNFLGGSKGKIKKLQKQHETLLKEAMELQRKGDIKGFALKTDEADKVEKQIIALQED